MEVGYFFFSMKHKITPSNSILNQFTIYNYKGKVPLGNFIEPYSSEELSQKLSSAEFMYVKDTLNKRYELHLTTDIGIGIPNHLSKEHIIKLLSLYRLPKTKYIQLNFIYNTIFAYLDIEDINTDIFLTKDTYLTIDKQTKDIVNITIGEPIPFNIVRDRPDLDSLKFPIDQLHKASKLRRIDLILNKNNLDIIF